MINNKGDANVVDGVETSSAKSTFDQTDTAISFTSATYYDENNKECEYNPANFIPGTYIKVEEDL